MKKMMMMMAMLAVSFAMQAQTKFHDVELNEATGPVKSITQSGMMGRGEQVINFTQDGKMQAEGLTGQVYDENGYLQKVSRSVETPQGNMTITTTYKWENGKVKSQSMDFGQGAMTQTYTYNEKGAPASMSMDMMGNAMETPYTDYKYDDHGNWISRKMSMMGQEVEMTRKIVYYE
ncbi:MAG: hypothetical protein IJ892_09665 [Prevotella sp.]|jgi:hypothetical protein|nr:hypothetical protein [Prevotella sp.]